MAQKQMRVREAGITIGVLQPGVLNSITDVPGVPGRTYHPGSR
jgi:hypothetical protein